MRPTCSSSPTAAAATAPAIVPGNTNCNTDYATATTSPSPSATTPPERRSGNPSSIACFSEIQKNWAGEPLVSYEAVLNYARTTSTTTGLQVKAYLIDTVYPKGQKVSDQAMDALHLRPHDTQPIRNYTLSPN